MKKSLVFGWLLVASIAQAESSFNEVRDVVFSPTEAKNSLEQQELNVYLDNKLPHYEVSSSNFIKDGVNLLVGDAQRTLNETADYYPRLEKHLHSNGICFAGTWSITKKTPYTGYFKQGAQGLMIARASTALTETQRGDPRAFGMAGKLFPTTNPNLKVKTANFFTVDVLAGTQRDHYLDVKMTNDPKTGFRFAVIPLAFYVGRVFNKADEQAGFRPVTAFAELGLKQGEVAKAPRYLMVQGAPSNIRNEAVDFRDELNIEKNHGAKPLIFKILVSDSSGDQDSSDWQEIGNITFTESKVSYGCDRRLHFAHPKIRK
ncbi:MAG: hypothetical protein IPM78_00855 [Moraxellaceae bacterium]|nr:hypothetical protein [Moraxellaceae bacterium]